MPGTSLNAAASAHGPGDRDSPPNDLKNPATSPTSSAGCRGLLLATSSPVRNEVSPPSEAQPRSSPVGSPFSTAKAPSARLSTASRLSTATPAELPIARCEGARSADQIHRYSIRWPAERSAAAEGPPCTGTEPAEEAGSPEEPTPPEAAPPEATPPEATPSGGTTLALSGRRFLTFRFRTPRLAIYPLRVVPRPEPRPPAFPPAPRPGAAALPDGFGPGGTTSRSLAISTTVVGGSISPAPQSRTTGEAPPSEAITARCASTSSPAELPLRASSRPPLRASGRHHPASRSSGATARAVTTSAPAGGPSTTSSARPRTTVTVDARPRAVTASDRNAVRRASGSTRVMLRSGRATASTIPGKPAPDPTSTTEAPIGMISDMTAQFTKCRSQIRGASRGPIKPRTTPSVTSSRAYETANSSRSPNTRAATSAISAGGKMPTGSAPARSAPAESAPAESAPPNSEGEAAAKGGDKRAAPDEEGDEDRPGNAIGRRGPRRPEDRPGKDDGPDDDSPGPLSPAPKRGSLIVSPPPAPRSGGWARRPPTRSARPRSR